MVDDSRPSHRFNWAEQLSAVLNSIAKFLVAPISLNNRLAQFLRRIAPLVERLNHLSEDDFCKSLEAMAVSHPQSSDFEGEGADEDFSNFSLDEVERWITKPTITKQQLLGLVRRRFEGSTGTLSKLSKQMILERVEALVMNERSHQTLARLASSDAGPPRIEHIHSAPPESSLVGNETGKSHSSTHEAPETNSLKP